MRMTFWRCTLRLAGAALVIRLVSCSQQPAGTLGEFYDAWRWSSFEQKIAVSATNVAHYFRGTDKDDILSCFGRPHETYHPAHDGVLYVTVDGPAVAYVGGSARECVEWWTYLYYMNSDHSQYIRVTVLFDAQGRVSALAFFPPVAKPR
jgi:hypothetical protein